MSIVRKQIADYDAGILLIGDQQWMGGVTHIEMLCRAILALPKTQRPRLSLVVLDGLLKGYRLFDTITDAADSILYVGGNRKAAELIIQQQFEALDTINDLFNRIDFLYPLQAAALPQYCAVSWIPDFQHVYLPELFSRLEIEQRDAAFQKIAQTARIVVLNSEDTKNEFKNLYPESTAAVHILNLHPLPVDAWYGTDPEQTQKKYGLPDRFLICCNQFWQHKNHLRLLEALALLKKRGHRVNLVCTGGTDDYRAEGYFSEVKQTISELGIDDSVYITGSIPRTDQIQLMRRAQAVVQPTLFEGAGLVVEEARMLGKTVLLSDIARHYEQAPEYGVYFSRVSSSALADAIENLLPSLSAGPDRHRELQAKRASIEMAHNLARQFCALVLKACQMYAQKRPENKTIDRQYLVSAIVSTYSAERFMRGCLEDLVSQTIGDNLEIIVVDSGSRENEAAIVREFQMRHHNIKYIRTENRETVYAAWNRGIRAASGKYITNANTDDRHRPDAFEIMVNVLEARPEVVLVYADVLKTKTPNETFTQCHPIGKFSWYDWDRDVLLNKGCFIGPQPVWRKSVHKDYGYFDESLVTSGDYEFWLRISQTYDFQHIRMPLGLYLIRPDSIEHREDQTKQLEDTKIRSIYRDAARKGILIRNTSNLCSWGNQDDALTGVKINAGDNDDMTPPVDPLNRSQSQSINQGGIDVKDYENIYQAIQPLFNSGSAEDAIAALENLVNAYPEFARAHYDLGSLYYHNGEKDKALTRFQEAVRLEPASSLFKKSMADYYYVEQNRIEDALKIYKEIIAVEESDPQILLTAGHLCAALQQFEDAKQLYERALIIQPDNDEARQYLAKLPVSREDILHPAIFATGSSQSSPGLDETLPPDAISQLEKKIQANPDDALSHNDLGVLYYKAGDKEKALLHYEQAAKLEPANIIFQKNLADFYFVEKGMTESALKIYVNVLTIQPEDIETLMNTGHICIVLEQFEDARVFFERILEIEPWNSEAGHILDKLQNLKPVDSPATTPQEMYQQAQALRETSDVQAVIDALENLLKTYPDFALAHNDLGVLYYNAGDKQKALKHYESAVQLETSNIIFKKNLADYYYVEQNRVEDALKLYTDVLATNPKDVETLIITGHICVALHQFDDAKVFYSRILEIEPWNADARQNLENLELRRKAV
jgi:tetratricopeptide (TPR) repeat protein